MVTGWEATTHAPCHTERAPVHLTSSRLILVVEDDPCVRTALVELLQTGGYACLGAGTIRAAKRVVQDCRPDLVLCDFHLPDGTARHLLQSMTDRPWASPVVLHTAAGPATLHPAAHHALVHTVLAKPTRPTALLDAVRQCLHEQPHPHRRPTDQRADRRTLLDALARPANPAPEPVAGPRDRADAHQCGAGSGPGAARLRPAACTKGAISCISRANNSGSNC
jgi:CheY-like chemotaxis protein